MRLDDSVLHPYVQGMALEKEPCIEYLTKDNEMTLLSLRVSAPPAAIRRLSPWKQRVLARYRRSHRVGMLHRTHAAASAEEWPDPTYWTAYDYLAIEREAQGLRRAYAYALVARVWRRLKRVLKPRT